MGRGRQTPQRDGVTRHSIPFMIATTAPENIASHRVLVNAGMVKGEFRNNEDGSYTQVFEYTAPKPR